MTPARLLALRLLLKLRYAAKVARGEQVNTDWYIAKIRRIEALIVNR